MNNALNRQINQLTTALLADRLDSVDEPTHGLPSGARVFKVAVADFLGTNIERSSNKVVSTAHSFAEAAAASRQAHVLFRSLDKVALGDRGAMAPLQRTAEAFQSLPIEGVAWDSTARKIIKLGILFDYVRTNDVLATPDDTQRLDLAMTWIDAALMPIFPDFNEWAAATYRNLGLFELTPYQRSAIDKQVELSNAKADDHSMRVATKRVADVLKNRFMATLDDLTREQKFIVHTLVKADEPIGFATLLRDIGVRPNSDHAAVFSLALRNLEQLKAVRVDSGQISMRGEDFRRWYLVAANIPATRITTLSLHPSRDVHRDVA